MIFCSVFFSAVQQSMGAAKNEAGAPMASGAARYVTEAQERGRSHAYAFSTEGRALPPPLAALLRGEMQIAPMAITAPVMANAKRPAAE